MTQYKEKLRRMGYFNDVYLSKESNFALIEKYSGVIYFTFTYDKDKRHQTCCYCGEDNQLTYEITCYEHQLYFCSKRCCAKYVRDNDYLVQCMHCDTYTHEQISDSLVCVFCSQTSKIVKRKCSQCLKWDYSNFFVNTFTCIDCVELALKKKKMEKLNGGF